ncbi:MAG: FecR domain-containing protein [Bacteroidia bacterium]
MNDWNKDDTFLARWLSNELTEQEKKAFEASDEYADYLILKQTTDSIKPLDFDVVSELSELKQKLTPKKEVKKTRPIRTWYIAAASVVLLIGTFLIYQLLTEGNGPVVTESLVASKSSLELPDGSFVKLNSESKVTYNPKNWEENRSLTLEGEAFFEVSKGSKFTVSTNNGSVEVLGTSFNVKDRNSKLEVLCYTGKVRVSSSSNEKIITPGQGVVMNGSQIEELNFNATQPGWLNGVISFNNTSLKEAVEEYERQFGFSVDLPEALANEPFNGSFPSSDASAAIELLLGGFENCNYSIDTNSKRITVNLKE